MMDLALAFLLLAGGHELGHDLEARRQRVPLRWGIEANWPVWRTAGTTSDQRARIAGAGFRGQDTVARLAAGSFLESSMRLVSAALKADYLMHPHTRQIKPRDGFLAGDLAMLNQAKPSAAGYFLAASAAADIYKAIYPDTDWDLGFWQADDGTPGLVLSMRF